MKHFFVAFVMLVSLILSVFSFGVADAALINKPFGGKVLLTPIPGVTCAGLGQAVIMTGSTLPVYLTNPLKREHVLGYALGLRSMTPNVTTCYIGETPISVYRTTKTYGVSR